MPCNQITCCGGPLSLYAASMFLSIYIVIINILQITAMVVRIVISEEVKELSDKFIIGSYATIAICISLIFMGFIFFIVIWQKYKWLLKWMTILFPCLILLRLSMAILMFLLARAYTRVLGDLCSIGVYVYAVLIFWNFYKELKMPRVEGAEPEPNYKQSVRIEDSENAIRVGA